MSRGSTWNRIDKFQLRVSDIAKVMARLYDKHFSFPRFVAKVILRQMHAWLPRVMLMTHRWIIGGHRVMLVTGNILKAWYIIPLPRYFIRTPSYISVTTGLTLLHVAKKMWILRNYRSFSCPLNLSDEKKIGRDSPNVPKRYFNVYLTRVESKLNL